jgi:hypothetical protein
MEAIENGIIKIWHRLDLVLHNLIKVQNRHHKVTPFSKLKKRQQTF